MLSKQQKGIIVHKHSKILPVPTTNKNLIPSAN